MLRKFCFVKIETSFMRGTLTSCDLPDCVHSAGGSVRCILNKYIFHASVCYIYHVLLFLVQVFLLVRLRAFFALADGHYKHIACASLPGRSLEVNVGELL